MKRWSCLFLMLAGCTDMMAPPSVDQLDWNPPRISSLDCPDFSGRYVAPSGTHYDAIFPKYPEPSLYTLSVDRDDRSFPIEITIRSQANGVLIRADDGHHNSVESFSEYDGRIIGCYNRMIVARYMWLGGGGENMNCRFVTYGERRIFMNDDGDLEVVHLRRRRCAYFGSLASQVSTKEEILKPRLIFRRVGR